MCCLRFISIAGLLSIFGGGCVFGWGGYTNLRCSWLHSRRNKNSSENAHVEGWVAQVYLYVRSFGPPLVCCHLSSCRKLSEPGTSAGP